RGQGARAGAQRGGAHRHGVPRPVRALGGGDQRARRSHGPRAARRQRREPGLRDVASTNPGTPSAGAEKLSTNGEAKRASGGQAPAARPHFIARQYRRIVAAFVIAVLWVAMKPPEVDASLRMAATRRFHLERVAMPEA